MYTLIVTRRDTPTDQTTYRGSSQFTIPDDQALQLVADMQAEKLGEWLYIQDADDNHHLYRVEDLRYIFLMEGVPKQRRSS